MPAVLWRCTRHTPRIVRSTPEQSYLDHPSWLLSHLCSGLTFWSVSLHASQILSMRVQNLVVLFYVFRILNLRTNRYRFPHGEPPRPWLPCSRLRLKPDKGPDRRLKGPSNGPNAWWWWMD